ncbi:hypothetical protein ACIQOW_01375 [Kitasatospora sp. NPDC091335]|uniref:hypothetical protein n=1 Tax=Kitasatospora sp. NPDC091335 TaxID=3364085 RepID=UPI00380988DC
MASNSLVLTTCIAGALVLLTVVCAFTIISRTALRRSEPADSPLVLARRTALAKAMLHRRG